MKRALLVPAMLLLTGCNFSSPGTPAGRSGDTARAPLQAPPGSLDDSMPESFDRLVARARSLDSSRRSIEALRLYRQALAAAPTTLPPDERKQIEARITALSFLLGVPQSDVASEPAAAGPAQAASGETLQKARALYGRAQELAHTRPTEALELYKQVLRTIQEKDDSSLYWNAWQKVEDLSPEGEGPAAVQEKQDMAEARLEARAEEAGADDGSTVAGGPEAAAEGRAADVSLSQARAAYIKGMEYVKAGDSTLARQAFQSVLELIRESQDPELYRAARQNLEDLPARATGTR